jgi:rod shape determining protein RodA
LSLATIASIHYDGTTVLSRTFLVQALAFGLGLVLMIAVLYFDYNSFEKFEKFAYIGTLIFQCTVYIPGLGIDQYGSQAWIDLRVTTLQPSEFVKIAFVLLFACYLDRHKKDLGKFKGFCFAFLYAAPIIGVVALEDTGAAIVLIFMFVGMIFYAGLSSKIFLRLAVAFILALPIAYRFMQGHQKDRIDAWLHPDNLSISATYQVYQSKIAIGSGGIFGKGLFNGTQKELDFVPVKDSDFIFSVIAEELGFVGGAALIAAYGVFISRIWKIATSAKEMFGSLIATGFLCMFGFQAFENIAMTMGMMPVTGITLPFISAGGTSIMANMIALGLILSVGIRSKSINF